MSTIRIDDRSSSVTYSQPAVGHHWTSQGSSTSYANTLSLTRTLNAFASVTFTGSSIAVYGLISDSVVSDVAPVSGYTIDGGTMYTYTATQTSNVQSQILFFKSDPLSNGQHTLVVTNLAEGDFFWLDYFDVTPNTSNAPTTTTTTNPGQDSTTIIIQTLTTTFADASTTRTAISTSVSTSVVSHSSAYSGSSSTPTGQDSLSPSSTTQPEKKTPVGAIAGGVVAGILLIIIVVFLLVCFKRRRRKAEGGIKLESPSAWAPPQTGIVPFGVPVDSLDSTSQLNTAPSPSITSYPYRGFNQQNMVSGRSVPTYGQVYPAVPQGKRQVTMPSDYSSTTGLVNAQQMEQDQHRAHASSPSSSSGTTNVSRGRRVADNTGISHSGVSEVGGIYGGTQEEDSPPAYQANTGEGAGVSNHLATTRKQ